ncbi:Hypothetical predicted protein [Podarcis lilfordi]|uniref:Uncharacterized protein n=1 Tax=Podarcis lilfordi TaxID=74358 RepID=A0AA35LHW7_9SAUR|nr:Hypothetical predicted protein [Podarcis lilfordi]
MDSDAGSAAPETATISPEDRVYEASRDLPSFFLWVLFVALCFSSCEGNGAGWHKVQRLKQNGISGNNVFII